MTTSSEPSSNGRCSASASIHSMPSPCASGWRGPAAREVRGEVARRHPCAALRGRYGRVAGAGGHIQHAGVRSDPGSLNQPLADGQQERVSHQRVVAVAPRCLALSSVSAATSIVMTVPSHGRRRGPLGRNLYPGPISKGRTPCRQATPAHRAMPPAVLLVKSERHEGPEGGLAAARQATAEVHRVLRHLGSS